VSYLGVIRDITRKKRAEKQLLQAEKLSMTGKIARSIAHEVRNPLTNLSLALEQLKDEVDNTDDADLYFDIIKRNAGRISKLIDDLMNSSKTREMKLEPVELDKVVNEALQLVKDRLKLKNIKLKTDLEQVNQKLNLDSEQIRNALLNLFINAIEAMEPDKGVLEISTAFNDDEAKIEVRDNGKGIPEKHLNSLFEPFFSNKEKGSGLGLVSVQNIVNAHKGNIDVSSEMGKGTTFTIYIPIKV
jgi:signal transduction histidine kinase